MATYEEQQAALNAQLPAGTAGAALLQQQPTNTGLTLNFPSTLSALDFGNAADNIFTPQDTKKLIGDLQTQNLRIADLLKPSAREQELKSQIGNITGGLETTVEALRFRPGLDQPTFGAAVSSEEQTARARLNPLQRELQTAQEGRAGQLAGEQAMSANTKQMLDFARQAQQDAFQRQQAVMQQVNTLTDNARQAFNTLVTTFGGLAFEDLDPASQQQLKQLAKNVGLPEGIIREGMQTIKDRQIAQKSEQQAQLQAQRDIQNQISLARLEIAAGKAGIKDEEDISNLSLYVPTMEQALAGGATPEQAVFAASAIANNLGTKLSKAQQTALLSVAKQFETQQSQFSLDGITTPGSATPTSPIEQRIQSLKASGILSDADVRNTLRRDFPSEEIDNSSIGTFQSKIFNTTTSFFSRLFGFGQ